MAWHALQHTNDHHRATKWAHCSLLCVQLVNVRDATCKLIDRDFVSIFVSPFRTFVTHSFYLMARVGDHTGHDAAVVLCQLKHSRYRLWYD